jgi:predicted acyl esterase
VIIERDILVPTTHGDPVAVDVFRPDAPGGFATIVTMSPYGKDIPWQSRFPLYEQTDQGPDAVWETPFPDWWVARGYAVIRADTPGTGKSPGSADLLGPQEVDGYVDTIEWAAAQPWSNGRVGALGISWLAMLQWHAAARRPPHLRAVVPWEGSSDVYREFARHGGILSSAFVDFWWKLQIAPQLVGGEDAGHSVLLDQMREREFIDDWYLERTPDLSKIDVPVLMSGNWGSLVLHQRGVLEAFNEVGSSCAQLIVTSGTHIGPFYEEWAKERQKRFLDRWLKGEPNGAETDPPVRLAIRDRNTYTWRDENEWPIARTVWTPWRLDARTLQLGDGEEYQESSVPLAGGDSVEFHYKALSDLELTGPLSLRLWISSTSEDADLFVRVHLDADGERIYGIGPQGAPIPMGMGWLRASHREIDPKRSLPYRPYHVHRRRLPLRPGVPEALDIEIWPTSIVLRRGDTLTVEISDNDDQMGVLAHNDFHDRGDRRLSGDVTIHTGGPYDSHLLAPVVPPRG